MKKRGIPIIMAVVLMLICLPVSAQEKNDDIVILYENDVHCEIDGYSKLKAMKNELAEVNQYTGIVSVGDYIQGASIGAISQGKYIVDIMNQVGYDAVTLGNHEFDYKLSKLQELVEHMNTKPVCANFQKISDGTNIFQPYDIVSYGETDVAYIGITTPYTLTSSSPAQFKDADGNYIYTFHGEDFYNVVQENIDHAKTEGADYIVALAHLGTENAKDPWSAQKLVENTAGLDVVLDGHSHSVVEKLTVKDETGEEVLISSTGTKFANIGKLTITDDEIKTELISTEEYKKTDAEVTALVEQIKAEYSVLGERKIGESTVNLTIADEEGNRVVRTQETNLGDFCADAYRIVMGADIGFINAGGIRDHLEAGEITFNDILNVFPFNNDTVVVNVTGQTIVDMLELGAMNHPQEEGTFQHVSGITFDLDSSIPTPVILDENKVFVKVDGERRISNVQVLDSATGTYIPIELTSKYTLASHSYLLLEQGGGASMFKDAEVISISGILDVELLEMYIRDYLGGVIGEEYADPQGRINIVEKSEESVDDEKNDDTEKEEEIEKSEETLETQQEELVGQEEITVQEEAPKTGDNHHICIWGMLMIVSAGYMLKVKKRRRSDYGNN